MSDKRKIYDYIKRTINPYGRPFEGTAYEFGIKIMDFIENMDGEKENGWIPVSERVPDGGDCRYFMCLLENHLEDVPVFLQYNESVGFGFYTDIYDPVTLGFVDTEFSTVKELGYEEVLYWRELLNPPKED